MIRNCQITDSPAIQRLNKKELGYNYPLNQTTKNLANILNDPQHHWLLVLWMTRGRTSKDIFMLNFMKPLIWHLCSIFSP